MPSPVKITLSHEEKKQLEKNITSRKTAVRLVERSKIILLAADNVPNYRIALQLGIGVNKVGRWRNRYAERGMQGIEKDLPRGANHNVINLVPNSLFCLKISSIQHHLKESDMSLVPAVPTTDQAVFQKII